MTEPSPPSPPPWGRLAVTLGLLGVTVALPQLPIGLPGVDAWTAHDQATSVAASGVFALGITPLVSAMGLVELVAVAVPRWRPLRHGGPAGRATLGRAALVVAAVLCALQGFGVAQLLEPLGALTRLGLPSMLMVTVSLSAGTFVLVFLAQLAGARGLVSGLAVIGVGGPVLSLLQGGLSAPQAAGAALSIFVTWTFLRPRAALPGLELQASGYRTQLRPREPPPLAVPAPAGGVEALPLAGAILGMAAMMRKLAGGARPLFAGETVLRAVSLVLIVALAVCLTWLFNAPSRVAGLAARNPAPEAGEDAAAMPVGMREATLRSVAFVLMLYAIGRVTHDDAYAANAVLLALGTALALDAAAEWQARAARPDLVPVWPEHRPYALAVARSALGRAGIALHARGENLRRLLQFAGPFVPIDLMVPRADATRATELLAALLRYHSEDQPGRRPLPPARSWTRLEGGLLAIALVLGGSAMLFPGRHSPGAPGHAPARPDALLILAVDDDHDLFDPPPANLPEGVSILAENAPLGPEGAAMRHYARLIPAKGEGQEQARARLLRWADAVALPRSLTVRAEAVLEYDDATDTTAPIGWRTMLVQGAPVIDGADVKDAVAREAPRTRGGHGPASGEGATVHIELAPASAERFRAFTASHVKRRLAIVVDGVVESAPVILSAIDGGRLTITMGAASPEDQLAAARALEARLLGRP